MSARGPGDALPRALRKAGPIPTGKCVIGRALSVATRRLTGGNSQPDAVQPSTASPAATVAGERGKAAGKGKFPTKGFKSTKNKTNFSDSVLEIYLCGGASGVDVMLLEAWEEDVRVRLAQIANLGSAVRVGRCLVVPHTDKTKYFCTSRAPMYLKALAETTMEQIADVPDFLAWHPVTPLASLVSLDPKSLVCVAGRVIPPSPVVAHVKGQEGEGDVPVANVTLRANNEVIKVSFWRSQAQLVEDPLLSVGKLVMISGVAKPYPGKDADPRLHVSLRAVTRTAITECPETLARSLESTPATSEGAKLLSPEVTQRKDYSNAKSEWMTLSVLDALLKGNQIREISNVFQIPSVHVELEGSPTYMACSKCFKAWNDVAWAPRSCFPGAAAESRTPRWRGKVVLRDGSACLQATCFDAFSVIADYAEKEMGEGRPSPVAWQNDDHVAKAMSYIGALPLTVLVALGGDARGTGMQATVQLVQSTFSPGNERVSPSVSHPMKVPVHLSPTEGACPPCALSDSSYDEALGLTVIDGIAFHTFRALLKVASAPPAQSESQDTSSSRGISCVLDPNATSEIELRDDDAGIRLRDIDEGAHIHAVLAWESSKVLQATAFIEIRGDVENFKTFFQTEVRLQKDALAMGPSFVRAITDTPGKVISAAESADTTAPPSWKRRKGVRD